MEKSNKPHEEFLVYPIHFQRLFFFSFLLLDQHQVKRLVCYNDSEDYYGERYLLEGSNMFMTKIGHPKCVVGSICCCSLNTSPIPVGAVSWPTDGYASWDGFRQSKLSC